MIDEREAEKLQESLLKKLFIAIRKQPGIKQDVTIKGYTKALHVDTFERRMHVTDTHLYPSSYHQSTFYTRKDNINRKKLFDERKSTIEAMAKNILDGETIAKSIKVMIKKFTKG